MINIEFYDGKSNLTFPSGRIITSKELYSEYPVHPDSITVLEYLSNNIVGSINSLDTLRQVYNISDKLSDNEALEFIKTERNKPLAISNTSNRLVRSSDIEFLGQQITEIELIMLENNNVSIVPSIQKNLKENDSNKFLYIKDHFERNTCTLDQLKRYLALDIITQKEYNKIVQEDKK